MAERPWVNPQEVKDYSELPAVQDRSTARLEVDIARAGAAPLVATVEFDMSEIREFFQSMERAAKGDFKKDMEEWLEAVGTDFLRVVQDEIVRRKVLDTRLLLNSFTKGDGGNVWELSDGDLTLEVGTNVEYAGYVNDGHWTNPKGVQRRWVPGYWEGDRFIYDPSAKTGMLLKQH